LNVFVIDDHPNPGSNRLRPQGGASGKGRIEDVAVSGQTLSFTATIATDATPGKRSLVVTYPDCTQAELKDLVEIKPAT
jgi:hypothetical protein